MSEQLEDLERESHTRGASSENEGLSKGNVEAAHLAGAAQPLVCAIRRACEPLTPSVSWESGRKVVVQTGEESAEMCDVHGVEG